MKKIDIIEECGDCSNRFYEGDELFCGIENEVVKVMSIPSWCPLDNAENITIKHICER